MNTLLQYSDNKSFTLKDSQIRRIQVLRSRTGLLRGVSVLLDSDKEILERVRLARNVPLQNLEPATLFSSWQRVVMALAESFEALKGPFEKDVEQED